MNHTDAATRLQAVLIAENQALARHDAAAATAFLAEKLAAANGLSPETLSLEEVGRLRHLALENRRLLEQAMKVQSEIIAMVVRAAQATIPAIRYGAAGRAVQPEGALAMTRRA